MGAESTTFAAPTPTVGTTYYYCVVTNTDVTADNTTATATTNAVFVTVVDTLAYDFRDLGVTNSAGTGYTVVGDFFKVPNGMYNAASSLNAGGTLTAIYFADSATTTAVLMAEDGDNCTSFTFKDLGLSVWTNTDNFSSFRLVLKDKSGGVLYDETMGASSADSILTDSIVQLSSLYTSYGPWDISNVSAIEITYDLNVNSNEYLTFENITISDVLATTDAETPNIDTQPADKDVLVAEPATLTVAASVSTGTLSYQWYSNTSDSNTGGTLITDATSATYQALTVATGTMYYYCIVTNTDNTATGNTTASATSDAATVVVKKNGDAETPNITTQPADETVLKVGVATLTVSASVSSGDLTYQWYSNTTDSNTGGAIIGSATAASYTAPTTTSGIHYYYCDITNTDEYVTGNTTATINTDAVFVRVNNDGNAETPNITTQPTDKTVLKDGTAVLSVGASVSDGTLSYQWYSNDTDSNTGGAIIGSATAASYTSPTITPGINYYYCVITNTDEYVTENTTATINTDAVFVRVNKDGDAETPSITTQPTDKAVLTDETATLTANASVSSGTLDAQWYSNTTDSNTGGVSISGATLFSYTAPTSSAGVTYYYCVFTNTDEYVSGSNTTTATTNAASVTVSVPVDAESPTIDTQPVSKSVLVGETANLTVTASVSSGILSYQWYSDAGNSNSGGVLIVGAEASTYSAPTTTAATIYYYCEVTNTDVGATGSKTAMITTDAVSVTVSIPVYTVTFDSNGGSSVSSQNVVEGNKAIEPTNPTRPNNVFGGWYADNALTNIWDFDVDTVVAETTLYAKWTPVYIVTFDSNGGSSVPLQEVMENLKATKPTDPTRSKYVFDGWYADSIFTDTWDFGTDTVVSETTLYAKWKPIFTVSFDSNGGSSVSSQFVVKDKKAIKPANPTRSNYVFDGWYENSTLSNAWNFDTDTVVADTMLYAKWTHICTVTFDSNGGSSVPLQKVETGNKATKPASPTRSNYVFGGWYENSALTNAWNFGTDTVVSDTMLYAKWTRIYTVNFESNGGSLISFQKVEKGKKVTQPASPTRPNYIFSGWFEDGTFNNAWDFDKNTVIADTTIFAKWSDAEVNVTMVDITSDSEALDLGETLTLTAVVSPSNATYPNVSWSSSNTSFATIDQNGKVTAVSAGTVTITATADGASDTCTVSVNENEVATSTIIIIPKSTEKHEEDGSVTITISVSDLPDGTVAIKTPSGEIIEINGLDTVEIKFSQEDISADGTFEIITIDEEGVALASFEAMVSDVNLVDTPKNENTGNSFIRVLLWILVGILMFGIIALVTILVLKNKRVYRR